MRLLKTKVQSKNVNSNIYNFGVAGWTARDHIDNKTIQKVASLVDRPNIIFINLGINSAKKNLSQDHDLRILIEQVLSYNILPVLIKPNNIGVADNSKGVWKLDSCPDNWYLMDNWQNVRDNIEEVAKDYNLPVIDLGSDNTLGDISLLYDSFHPSKLGHKAIFVIYNTWLEKHILIKILGYNIVVENDYILNIRKYYQYLKL